MTSADPTTCVFLVSCGRSPIRLVDAYTGNTRANYKPFLMERLISPHSLCFSPDGSLIIGGSHGSLWIFSVDSPGVECDQILTRQDDFKQTGIISSISFCPREKDLFATGSYSGSIALWDMRMFEMTNVFDVPKKGVTHMTFTNDGKYLLSGSRADDNIYVWDVRMGKKLSSLKRDSSSNQRMFFDANQYILVSGNLNGNFTVWNIKDSVFEDCPLHFEGHGDCANGVSLHPTLPILTSCSGSRKFPSLAPDDESDDEIFSKQIPRFDNSLRMWDLIYHSSFITKNASVEDT